MPGVEILQTRSKGFEGPTTRSDWPQSVIFVKEGDFRGRYRLEKGLYPISPADTSRGRKDREPSERA